LLPYAPPEAVRQPFVVAVDTTTVRAASATTHAAGDSCLAAAGAMGALAIDLNIDEEEDVDAGN
jgi:hypothetical protein